MEQDDDFFPRLVRFKFQLHCSKSTKQREGYTALQEKVKTSLADMKRTFKSHIIEATKLDQDSKNDIVLEEHVKIIRLIVEAYCLGQPNVATADKIVALMFAEQDKDLLQHLGSVKDFI